MIYKPSEVRIVRKKRGITQEKLAKMAGFTQPYIAKIESGSTDPRISTLEKISEALERNNPDGRITAGRVMAKPIVFVKPVDKVGKAIELMKSNDISQLPVLRGKIQVGSITDDLLIRLISEGNDIFKLKEHKVDEIMGSPLPTVNEEVGIEVFPRLLEHSPAVLVIDKKKPVGIVTKADVLQLSSTIS